MISSTTLARLHTLKAKIEAIFSSPAESGGIVRVIPFLDEITDILDGIDMQSSESLITASDYYRYIGRKYEALPFYPAALRSYVKSFSRYRRGAGELCSEEGPEKEKLCLIFTDIMRLRARAYKDTGAEENDLGGEYSTLMKNLCGTEKWEELLINAARAADEMPSACKSAYTQQYYNVLCEVETEAASRIAQLDPALVSPSSIDALRVKLFAARGIDWAPASKNADK